MTMKVLIDSEKCRGYGICADLCPSVFKLDDQGYVTVAGDTISDEDAQAAADAADACPESVITLHQV